MGKPIARLLVKDKETKENTEICAFWPSSFAPSEVMNASKLGGQGPDGEVVEVSLKVRKGGETKTITLGKEGSHFMNLYVNGPLGGDEDEDF